MRTLFLTMLTAGLALSGNAQHFVDRSDLLDSQNGNKHFSWSVSIADLDGNGLPDIHEPGILYLQQEDGTFVSSLPELGITYRPLPRPIIGYEGRGVFGAVMADLDDDGFNELFILDIIDDSSKVFTNAWGLRLTEVSPANGMDFEGLGQGGAVADFNGDGFLDFFFGEEQGHNQLFLGDGAGQFTETTAQAGITYDVQTYGVAAADYDNDGDLDVFIGACAQDARRSVNLLFRNRGDGTFEEVGASAGINDNGSAWGVNWLDYDRDGLLDVHVANMRISFFDTRGNKNKLYRNRGDGTFEDVSAAAGIEGNDDSYGSSVADFNNDGWPDIWAANFGSPPTIWINNGDGTFTDAYASSGLTDFFGNLSVSVADINRDGWIDAYSGADDPSGPGSRLLFNAPGVNHWLTLRLIQGAPNRNGIGARIQVWTGGGRQIQDIVAGDGFVSQNHDLSAPFGLGLFAKADSIIVRWPDGHMDYWYDVEADREVTLRRGGTYDAPPRPFRTLEILTKHHGSRIGATVAWEASEDPEGAEISYRVAVKDPSGHIVHVSEPLTGTEYVFDLDTTGVDLTGQLRFAVTASDGLHVRRSLNMGSVRLEGTANEVWAVQPVGITLDAVWPLPADQKLQARVTGARPSRLSWHLVDVTGRIVQRGELDHPGGESVLELDVSELAVGWYALRLQSDADTMHRPVLVAR